MRTHTFFFTVFKFEHEAKFETRAKRLQSNCHSDYTVETCTGVKEALSLTALHCLCYLFKFRLWLLGWGQHALNFKAILDS